MSRDGRDKFYRTLNLDKDTRALLKWFRDLKQDMINEPDLKEKQDESDK